MSTPKVSIHPLPRERAAYMQKAAFELYQVLVEFSDGPVEVGPVALQTLDEWIERQTRQFPLSHTNRIKVIAFLGQVFLGRHRGYWAVRVSGGQQTLGVVCPLVGDEKKGRFIDIAGQINRRLERGIVESLTFFYLTTSVDLQGRS